MTPVRPPLYRGFTLVELLVVMVVSGIILAMALPSFQDMLARKRLEGFTNELNTDLRYARSEALQKNVRVRLTVGTDCYAIHLASVTVDSSCNASSPSPMKIVTVPAGSGLKLESSSPDFIEFEPLRGMREAGVDTLKLKSTSTALQLHVLVSPVGRVSACSSPQAHGGYPSCS